MMMAQEWTYLLLGLVARARPFCDDIFFGFGIGRKGKGDAGESGSLQTVSWTSPLI
jgi:hypothetical protein